MNTCPPELHAYICQLACTDDGSTVRALSLVSSYFGEVARRFALQSISVTGWPQISQLSARLKQRSPQTEPIRNLYLSAQDLESSPDTDSESYTNSVLQLVSSAAPTLETLVLVLGSCPSSIPLLSRIYRIQFPVLRELSISGFYPFPSTRGSFPSLTHLHLNGNRNPYGLFSTGALKAAFPILSCLRVSGLNLATTFLQELEGAIHEDTDNLTPTTLREVVLQAAPAPPVTPKPTSAQLKHAAMMRKLDSLRDANANGVVVRVLECGHLDNVSMSNYWLDRMSGRPGGW
ncbi:hypothetical protein AX16_006903 [Volvariella volvacea WC 439]|nr:hypothetical protein AX16_006903 [Volvariella volvacea WC 439]